jgi:hypothetical protein
MIGDYKWNNKFKNISKKYNIYDVIYKLKTHINKINKSQQIFFLASLITYIQINKNTKFNINIDNMIFLKPNYNFLLCTENLDESNIDYKFSININNKIINLSTNDCIINYNNLSKISEPFIVLVRDRSPDDNLILIIPTLNMIGGKYVYNNNTVNYPGIQSGVGYDTLTHTRKGYQIGQYNPPSVDIDDVPDELQNHDSNQYPGDPLFGVKKLEGLIMDKKKGVNNFQKGFSSGFDNGYNKGYYFGYSSAAAYLYRYYKKFYKQYMEKYRQKLVEKQIEEGEDDGDWDEEDENQFSDMFGGWIFGNDDDMKAKLVEDELTRLTGQNFKLDPIFTKESLNELENDPLYKGLPDYMMPENTFSLEALQPRDYGILSTISDFFFPPRASRNPKLHCNKPNQKDLNHMLRLNFHPKFRDAIVSADRNWDEKIFRKSCNKYSLMLKKYCPTENHIGVEYDPKIGAFYKACKLKKDEDSWCNIM